MELRLRPLRLCLLCVVETCSRMTSISAIFICSAVTEGSSRGSSAAETCSRRISVSGCLWLSRHLRPLCPHRSRLQKEFRLRRLRQLCLGKLQEELRLRRLWLLRRRRDVLHNGLRHLCLLCRHRDRLRGELRLCRLWQLSPGQLQEELRLSRQRPLCYHQLRLLRGERRRGRGSWRRRDDRSWVSGVGCNRERKQSLSPRM